MSIAHTLITAAGLALPALKVAGGRAMPPLKVAVSLAWLSLLAAPLPAMSQGLAGTAAAESGKAAYVKNGCWQCHGFVGQGGAAGPKLAPNPLPLAAFSVFIRHTNGRMPPYQEAVLSNADLAGIHAYLESIAPPPDYTSIPLLREP